MDLDSPIQSIPRISSAYQKRLLKLGIKTLRDLFYHFPFRYDDFSNIKKIAGLKINETATIQGQIIEIKNIRTWKKRIYVTEAYVQDETGTIKVIWFNQPYIADSLKRGDAISLAGKACPVRDSTRFPQVNKKEQLKISNGVNADKDLYFSNPAYERLVASQSQAISSLRHTGGLIPVYPETIGLSSRWLRYIIKLLLPKFLEQIKDYLPTEIKRSQNLINLSQAIKEIHFPKDQKHSDQARRRLAFDELFLIQLFALRQKIKWQQQAAPKIAFDQSLIKNFVDSLPFKLTDAQRKAAWEILQDLDKSKPMNRLLEGDVGSGKTVVAAIGALQTVNAGYQVALMAPTEILAQQHFKTISQLFTGQNITIGLLTGNEAKIRFKFRVSSFKNKEILEKIASGQIQILIGTHALIQERIKFNNLGLVILDEQHRFGVNQRAALVRGLTQTETQTNAENKLLFEDITYKIRGCAMTAKKNIGLGHKESVYQKALEQEFVNAGLNFEREKQINIIYNGKKIGTYQPDFLIENKIIVELKALPFIGNTEKRQIWTYIKGSEFKVALLINYSPTDLDIKRIVYDTARNLPRDSASSPRRSAFIPHLLSMTATPIPRTLALTIYGDLDISLLDQMPKNRKPIITKIVASQERTAAYEFIRQQIKQGRQAFVICPRIETRTNADTTLTNAEIPREPAFIPRQSALDEVKAVKEEYEKLSKIVFPDLKIAMLHGKLKPKEKEKIMASFSAQGGSADDEKDKIDVLVSTSVVEVGVDIPNASVMMIEGSERFGLAQLHQFRGRVGRSEYQSYCLLFTDLTSKNNPRLKALISAKSGFELAEYDLQIRGPGEFYGTRQWGLPDLSMASLSDLTLVKSVREEAQKLLQKDPLLKNHPALEEKIKSFQLNLHLE